MSESIPEIILTDEGNTNNHDEACTEQAGRLTQMGFLEYELSAYGSAVYQEDEVYYYISSKEENLLQFLQECYLRGLYPTPVKYFYKRYDLLERTEEEVRADFRRDVALKLQKAYPKPFLKKLAELTAPPSAGSAMPLMKELMRQLDSCFDEKQLNIFEDLLQQLLPARLINREGYQLGKEWLKQEREKLAIEPTKAGVYQRTYAGFFYQKTNGETAYFSDAFAYMAKERRTKLIAQGNIVSPVLQFTYYADSYPELEAIKGKVREDLKAYLNEGYLQVMRFLRQLPCTVDGGAFEQLRKEVEDAGEKDAMETLQYYGHLWNVL